MVGNFRCADCKFDHHPQPQVSLVRISVCNHVSHRDSHSGDPHQTKNGSQCNFQNIHSLTKENQVSLLRIFLSQPDPEWKINGLGGWGWKNEPDERTKQSQLQSLAILQSQGAIVKRCCRGFPSWGCKL